MHRCKTFLIYPPNYKPGDGYMVRHSKFQAWKDAMRMEVGASVDLSVHIHPSTHKSWINSPGEPLWEVLPNAQGNPPASTGNDKEEKHDN